MEFAISQFDRTTSTRVLGTQTAVVLFQPALQIIRDTGIERAIGTDQDVERPLFAQTNITYCFNKLYAKL
jgi:hypothetical protein